jgi:hypothetical protein
VVKPAPPRPRRFEVLISASIASASARDRRPRASPAGQQHVEQGIAAADVVLDRKYSPGQSSSGTCRPDQFADAVDALGRHAGHRPAVDQQRRPLVAHAGAGSRIDADQPVLGNLAALDPQPVAQAIHQLDAAQHAVGDVVREEHAIATDRLQVEKRVKTGDPLDARARQPDRPGDRGQRRRRQVAQRFLRLAQNLHQHSRVTAVTVDDRLQQLAQPFCPNAFFRHASLPPKPQPFPIPCCSLLLRRWRVLMYVNKSAD